MSSVSFPLNYIPLQHVDPLGEVQDSETKHVLSQGWIQQFTQLNQLLDGIWERTKPSKTATISHCSFTPYSAHLYLEYSANLATDELTFPWNYYGFVSIWRGASIVQSTKCGGKNLTIGPILAGDIICGSLSA